MSHQEAILLCGHGTRDEAGRAEFAELVAAVRVRFPDHVVEHGFLEFARPTINESLESLRARGIVNLIAVPIMLTAAGHVELDLPYLYREFCRTHPGVTIHGARELGLGGRIFDAAAARIMDAARRPPDSVLVVAGRGAANPQLIHEANHTAALLGKHLGFAATVSCFCGIAEPSIEAGLRQALAYRLPCIVVFPFLLFAGKLLQRVYDQVDDAAQRHAQTTFIKAAHLCNHPQVIEMVCESAASVKIEE